MAKIEFKNFVQFTYETQAYLGVNKIAGRVKQDIFLVTGFMPGEYVPGEKCKNLVIYGTVDHSELLDSLENRGLLDLSHVRGKWETYSFQIVDNPMEGVTHALVIAGSDKRGTIYGLFHLSEVLGVSPFVDWNHVRPKKRKNVILTDECNMVSKEPSVKYRGFFINDEWPAFGTWAEKHFGGINATCYERIFELLLRLKGNYLWPAMWKSNFSLDGPGLESARLADEYGVVMSTSHHEPCMRSGEEFGLMKGSNSIYGDVWDFRQNEQGITRFWRDGLLRNKPFENVITLGMRGERDSAILDKNASLAENIALLRDVLKTQNRLIRETINEDLSKVPRQMVMFTEVEKFLYGDDENRGLLDDPELDGVTLMLCDNNFGCTRTLPTAQMRSHKGGYGMYYHMDMHGGAYSYQWIGTTYLPRVWEQMTQAYEFGVRETWVTNIGDIGTQEYGLSFFLDLAYDIERFNGSDAGVTVTYTEEWVRKQFQSSFSPAARETMTKVIMTYTELLAKRKHEIMNADVYDPLHYGEAQNILNTSEYILTSCEALKKKCMDEDLSAFISLLHFPACGTANLMKLWILAGRNKLYAKQNRIESNLLADEMQECVEYDEKLVALYHEVDDGYYDGFGVSEHFGFTNWNDEDNKYPIFHRVKPANQPRMLVARANDEHYMTGLIWNDHLQIWRDTMRPDVDTISFDLMNGSDKPFSFQITTDCPWMIFSKSSGEVKVRERIELKVRKDLIPGKMKGTFTVESIGYAKANITVETEAKSVCSNVFYENDGYIAMEAIHFQRKVDTDKGSFEILAPYGRTGSAIKVFPVTEDFYKKDVRPYVEYDFIVRNEGKYQICFYLAPSTPVVFTGEQYIGYSVNEEEICIENTVEKPEEPFFLSEQWEREAINNIKLFKTSVNCQKGVNKLRFYGMSPAIVLERIVLVRDGVELPKSYLGPVESYIEQKSGERKNEKK